MDLQLQVIYLSDSFGKPNDSIVNQCMRYLCYKYFSNTGKKVNLDMWKRINYCNADVDFPLQSDSHNCCPYICLITKCILQGKILRSQSVTCLRHTIAYELINNTILWCYISLYQHSNSSFSLNYLCPRPYGVDRTWKSGIVSYLGNVKLAMFTNCFWIYRGLMSDSWK